jgi:hypothetical protein
LGERKANRHATARKRQHDRIVVVFKFGERCRKLPASVNTISKQHD